MERSVYNRVIRGILLYNLVIRGILLYNLVIRGNRLYITLAIPDSVEIQISNIPEPGEVKIFIQQNS